MNFWDVFCDNQCFIKTKRKDEKISSQQKFSRRKKNSVDEKKLRREKPKFLAIFFLQSNDRLIETFQV